MLARNVGGVDRFVRVVLGATLLPIGFFLLGGSQGSGLTVLIVGLVVLTSGITGFCPPYVIFGISTARQRRSHVSGDQPAATGATRR